MSITKQNFKAIKLGTFVKVIFEDGIINDGILVSRSRICSDMCRVLFLNQEIYHIDYTRIIKVGRLISFRKSGL